MVRRPVQSTSVPTERQLSFNCPRYITVRVVVVVVGIDCYCCLFCLCVCESCEEPRLNSLEAHHAFDRALIYFLT